MGASRRFWASASRQFLAEHRPSVVVIGQVTRLAFTIIVCTTCQSEQQQLLLQLQLQS